MKVKWMEFSVGIFLLLAMGALLVLAVKVSQFESQLGKDTYELYADFDNVGGLKVRAPVRVAGVRIGEVQGIQLDPLTFRARVKMQIDKGNRVPEDSTISILTAGILGANYLSITPGFAESDEKMLKTGQRLEETYSAIILEDLIGKFFFNLGEKKDDE